MEHEEAAELLAVYVLDAVDPEESLRIEEHLATCPRCRAEVDAHREVAAALGNSVEPLPEALWARLAGRLGERSDHEPPPMPVLVHPSGPIERSRRYRTAIVGAFAAAAAVVAAVLGINLAHADDQVATFKGAIGHDTHAAVAAALLTPGHHVVTLKDADQRTVARFVLLPGGQGYLVSSTLPALPPEETYQLWGVADGSTVSLGLLGRHPSQVAFALAGRRTATVLAVTAEAAGGSVRPTAPMLATGAV